MSYLTVLFQLRFYSKRKQMQNIYNPILPRNLININEMFLYRKSCNNGVMLLIRVQSNKIREWQFNLLLETRIQN